MSVIGTCKLCRSSGVELCDSHFLSKAAYKLLRESQDGESPIMMDSQIAIYTDLQVRGHVFCRRCEDLLNKNGEAWVLRNCYRHEKGFALKDALDAARPVHAAKNLTVYTASNLQGIDVPKLAYFAASVFFRSAVHEWKSVRSSPARIRLGVKYENEIRSYLLGEAPFPKNAVLWVNVVTDDRMAGYFCFPYGGKERDYWKYDFQFMGLVFTLFVGGLVPRDVRQFCFVHSPEHYIAMNKAADDMILIHAGKLQTKSKPVGALKSWVEATSSR